MSESGLAGISVVVCCYNSANRIVETMRHLALQAVRSGVSWEVIVVDNNCSDDTLLLAEQAWAESASVDSSLRVISEPNPGLASAREAGARAAVYDYLIFCDDDNWLAPEYIQIAYDLMESHPAVGICGGRGVAVSDVAFPPWFTTYQDDYAVGVQSIVDADVTARGYVWGAGIVLRRVVLVDLFDHGFSFLCSGRKGGELLSGDDSELCNWFVLAGYRLQYSESLVYQHFITADRLTVAYHEEMCRGFRAAQPYLSVYKSVIRRLEKGERRRPRYIKAGYCVVMYRLLRLFGSKSSERYGIKFSRLFPRSTRCLTEDLYCRVLRNTMNYLQR